MASRHPADHRSLTAEQIRAQIAEWPIWRHRISLGGGIVTPGREDSRAELRRIGLPDDLTGLRVLDVGCSDGFFCFESEQRGAAEVIGVDDFSSTPGDQGRSGFTIAAGILGSRCKLLTDSVYRLSVQRIGTFDLVLFLNTLYHLKHPLLALETLAALINPGGTLLLKTYFHQDLRLRRWGLDLTRRPMMRFFPGDELNHDPSNWWAPNRRCLEATLRTSGFDALTSLGTWGNRIYYRCTKSA